jgi:hypothetical protein
MKNKILVLFLFAFGISFGQTNRIQFSYDEAGNQIQRKICPNCPAKNATDADYKNEETVTEKDMIEDEKVYYYPNPVREELYIKWKNTDGKELTEIKLYSMQGQELKRITDVKAIELAKIGFMDYPTGYYNIVLEYSNGEKKDLKIVKQ